MNMSRFQLIETESFPNYETLNMDRETIFRVCEKEQDQYGNKSSRFLMQTSDISHAKKFLRRY